MNPAKFSNPTGALLESVPAHSNEPSSADATAHEPGHTYEYLVEVVQSLSLAKTMPEITAIAGTAARKLTGADGASFVLRDGEFCFYADEDAIGPLWKGQRFPLDICISGWVMNNRQPAIVPDIFKDDRIPLEAYRPTFVRSLAMVPIRTRDPIGAIGNYWARSYLPSPGHVKLLQALADSTAVAIENIHVHQNLESRVRERTEQLEAANEELRAEAVLRKQMEAKVMRLSLTDDLTGLSNRRGFFLRAEQLLKIVHRLHTFAWLLYIDLDGLKLVNDQMGHEAGSQLIRNAAQVLRETFRESDVVARIGGDEFVVFAIGATASAAEIEKRLMHNMDHQNSCSSDRPPLSMSVGVVRCDPTSLHTLDEMIQQADAAMYIEKRRKRELQRASG